MIGPRVALETFSLCQPEKMLFLLEKSEIL